MKSRFLSSLLFGLLLVSCLSVSAYSGGIEIIDHKTEREGLFNNTVNAVSSANKSDVFIASAGGLHILIDYFFLPIFQNIPATGLSQDPAGDLWASAGNGFVYRIIDRDGIWTAVRVAFEEGKNITALAARHGTVTVGTDSGLYYYDDLDGLFRPILREGAFISLAAAADGTIIAGGRDGNHPEGGLLIVGGTFAARTGWVDELSGKDVTALLIDGGRLLIGTRHDGLFVLEAAGIHTIDLPEDSGEITALLSMGRMTLTGTDRGLYIETDKAFEPLSDEGGDVPAGITSLAAGPGGTVWVGTEKDGLYLIRVRP